MLIKKDRWYAAVGPFLRCLVVVGEDDGQQPLEMLSARQQYIKVAGNKS